MSGGYQTVREILREVFDSDNDYLTVATKGGAGFETPLYGWKMLKLGHRWNVALVYTSNVGAGSSYTSASWLAQDGSINNYLYFRMVVHNEGSTNVTYKIQQSYNNSTWYDIPSQNVTLTADGTDTIEGEIFMPYLRVVISNDDSNAQTANLCYIIMY